MQHAHLCRGTKMKTVQVTFSRTFTPGLDRAYTYKTADDLQVGQIAYVLNGSQVKKVQILSIDKVYNTVLERKFKGLAQVFATPPMVEKRTKVTRL